HVFTEDGRAVEAGSGEVGFVAISGWVPIGYYKDPEKSAKTFRTIDGVRYSIPGDYAMVNADSTLHLLGRGSVVINTGGENEFSCMSWLPAERVTIEGELTAEEARVLGCLVEKAAATPEYYPLTLNALVTACNQSSNRDPVVAYDPSVVTETLDDLRGKKLV